MKCKQSPFTHRTTLISGCVALLVCFFAQHTFAQEASSHPKVVVKSNSTYPFKVLRDLHYWDIRTITRIGGSDFMISGVGVEDYTKRSLSSGTIHIGVIGINGQPQLLGAYVFPDTQKGVPFKVKISIPLPSGFNPATFKGFVLTDSHNVADSQVDDVNYSFNKGMEFYSNANYAKALPYLQNAVRLGSGEAMNRVGLMYLWGQGVEVDNQIAFQMFSRSAEAGFGWGQYNVAYSYHTGNIVKQDGNKAIYWYEKAALQEIPDAYHLLGMMFYKGEGVPIDFRRAKDYFFKSAHMNYVPSYRMLAAAILQVNENDGEAIWWYKMAAERDTEDKDSPFAVAMMYYSGSTVDMDRGQALRWYKLAGERGHPWAANSVGVLYQQGGIGVPKNDQEAIKWFNRAIGLGNVIFGAYNLGEMYYYGKGMPVNEAKAFELFTKAKAAGNSEAGAYLGDMYALGQFVEKDRMKAEEEYNKALEYNSERAMYGLGNLYYDESLPAKDQDSRSLKYYRMAAGKSFAPARDKLMLLAEQGNKEAIQFADSLKAATVITAYVNGRLVFKENDYTQQLIIGTNTGLRPEVKIKKDSDLYKLISSEKDSNSDMRILTFAKKPMSVAGTYNDELEIIPEYGNSIKVPLTIEFDGKNVVDSGLFYVPEMKEKSSVTNSKARFGSSSTFSFWIKGVKDGLILYKTPDKKTKLSTQPYIFISENKLKTRTESLLLKKNKNIGSGFTFDLDLLNDNRWHLITICHNGNTLSKEGYSTGGYIELYIDGKSVEKQAKRFVTVPVYGEINSKDFYLKNVRFYERVLDAEEILKIYLAEFSYVDN